MILLGYISITLMGLSLGLMGAGGSILAVPILIYLFGIQAADATFYSLFIVGLSSLVGVIPYALEKRIKFKEAFIFFIPSLVGVLTSRRLILPLLPESKIKNIIILLSFVVVMLAASLSMLLKNKKPPKESTSQHFLKTMLTGFIVGMITGFVGVGGGFLIIPALVGGINLPMGLAVGTSMLIIATNSLLGFLVDAFAGYKVPWVLMLQLSTISVIGIFIGAKLNKKIPAQKLKTLFAWFVLILGGIILTKQLMSL